MRISTKSRYGLKACEVLAEEYGSDTPLSIGAISERTGTSDSYLEQIIMLLKKEDIVVSVRGAGGGYALSREPKAVTIGAVLRALEDGLEIAKCINGPCTEGGGNCRSREVWTRIYDGINSILDSITLQDMLDDNIKEKK